MGEIIKARRWKIPAKQEIVTEDFDFDAAALHPNQMAIRAECTAISSGTECANYLALDPDVYSPTGWCRYPWVPGYAGVGQVIGVGSAVKEFAVGDRVHGAMPHATHCVMDAHDAVVKVPAAVPPEQAAFSKIIGIGMTALQVVKFEPMMTVGVWGQGMIGNFCAQSFQRAGACAVGIDPVAQRRELSGRCGIRETLDPSDPKFGEQVATLTNGEGFDVVVDSTGHAPTAIGSAQHVRFRGQYVFLTHWRSQPAADASSMIRDFFWKSLTIYGAHESMVEAELGGRNRWITVQRRKWRRIMKDITQNGLQVGPMISHVVRPNQAKEAYEGLCFDKSRWWGVAVDWR